MYLLDTNVLSLSSPLNSARGSNAESWLQAVGRRGYLSVVSVSEVQFGVTRLRARGATQKAKALAEWLETVLSSFFDRVLPMDVAIGRRTGELLATAKAAGHDPGFEDACIAATAAVHGLIVVTNNVRHFAALGVAHQRPGD